MEKIAREEPQRRVIIFTHHSPCVDERANDPRHEKSEVTSGFVTDLRDEECWRNQRVKLWAFGHTHFNCDCVEKTRKRVLTNQKGYYLMPQKGFNLRTAYDTDA